MVTLAIVETYKKRFLLYLIYEIANFITKKVKQSKNAHACRISTPSTRGIDIRYGVGVDCLFLCVAFGDASR
jgi:hypothetical protein